MQWTIVQLLPKPPKWMNADRAQYVLLSSRCGDDRVFTRQPHELWDIAHAHAIRIYISIGYHESVLALSTFQLNEIVRTCVCVCACARGDWQLVFANSMSMMVTLTKKKRSKRQGHESSTTTKYIGLLVILNAQSTCLVLWETLPVIFKVGVEYGMEINSDRAKFSPTASTQDHLPPYNWTDKRSKKWISSNT